MMKLFIYDGSFDGMVSAIFDSFAAKCAPSAIVSEHFQQASLLDEIWRIETDPEKVERVLQGLNRRSAGEAATLIYKMFLSEMPDIEMQIYRLVRLVMRAHDPAILENFANEHVLYAAQVNKMISREVHRMHAFVRFQRASSGIYYALIDPDFNVLPLLDDHFTRRFADQPWLIFDVRRRYGLSYDLQHTCFVSDQSPVLLESIHTQPVPDVEEGERIYQQLWQRYFHAVNIAERNNTKLHLRHLPKRYWKYLVEKQMPSAKKLSSRW